MAVYQKVLVALDLVGMENNPVIQKAKAIGDLFGSELHLIHVVERLYTYGTTPFPTDLSDWQEEFEEQAKEKVTKIGTLLKVPPSRQKVISGNPKEEILEEAERIGATLIIIGSHSREGLSYMLLGSSANGVANAANCDVLVVKVKQ